MHAICYIVYSLFLHVRRLVAVPEHFVRHAESVFCRHFFFSSRRRHTRCLSDWSSDACSSDLKKTGQPVKFEMTEQTREAVDNYLAAARKKPGEFLFGGRRGRDRPITTRQYARLVGQWIAEIGRASCRERVYGGGVAGALKKKR